MPRSGHRSRSPPPRPKVKYNPPAWSTKPKYPCTLESTHKGTVLHTYQLDEKAFYLVGRDDMVCDIVVRSDTISRQHAVIQFGENGECYITDLGSTNGTHLNKKRLKAKVYHELQVGSSIQFGESSRRFVLCGPPELEAPETTSETLEKMRAMSEKRQLRKAIERERLQKKLGKTKEEDEDQGIDWGMGPDAVPEDEEEEAKGKAVPQVLAASDVNEKDRKLFDRIQKKRTKIDNMNLEMERIRAKESTQGSLTEGQEAQIARNQEAIEKIMKQIEDIEATIHDRNTTRAESRSNANGKGRAKSAYDSDDDDAFYDRTQQAAKKRMKRRKLTTKGGKGSGASDKAYTYDELLQLVKKDRAAERELLTQIEAAQARAAEQEAKLHDGMDELDQYMVQSAATAAIKERQMLERKLLDLRKELARHKKLSEIARPIDWREREAKMAEEEAAELAAARAATNADADDSNAAAPAPTPVSAPSAPGAGAGAGHGSSVAESAPATTASAGAGAGVGAGAGAGAGSAEAAEAGSSSGVGAHPLPPEFGDEGNATGGTADVEMERDVEPPAKAGESPPPKEAPAKKRVLGPARPPASVLAAAAAAEKHSSGAKRPRDEPPAGSVSAVLSASAKRRRKKREMVAGQGKALEGGDVEWVPKGQAVDVSRTHLRR